MHIYIYIQIHTYMHVHMCPHMYTRTSTSASTFMHDVHGNRQALFCRYSRPEEESFKKTQSATEPASFQRSRVSALGEHDPLPRSAEHPRHGRLVVVGLDPEAPKYANMGYSGILYQESLIWFSVNTFYLGTWTLRVSGSPRAAAHTSKHGSTIGYGSYKKTSTSDKIQSPARTPCSCRNCSS